MNLKLPNAKIMAIAIFVAAGFAAPAKASMLPLQPVGPAEAVTDVERVHWKGKHRGHRYRGHRRHGHYHGHRPRHHRHHYRPYYQPYYGWYGPRHYGYRYW